MRFCRVLLAVAALGWFTNVNAEETTKSAEKKCDKCPAATVGTTAAKCDAGKCCEGGSCSTACSVAVANAKEKLPKMTYRVGKETTCCSEAAAGLAEKSKEAVQFVVADKAYTCKNEAFTALVSETEQFVAAYVSVSKCEASGKSTVAGKSFDCCVEAGKKAELVQAAVKEVKVSFKVGDEEACCAGSAAALAKKNNKPIKYVVNGEATECELTSRLNLATAKYLAAVTALANSEKPEVATTLKKSDS